METVDIFEEEASYRHSRKKVLEGNEMPVFGEFIYDDQDGVIVVGVG
jgi:hypothetical protein